VESYVCEHLGLYPAPVSTQIIQRDRHAEYMTTLAIVGSTLEKIATEIRHLQKTEVLEAEEFFGKGQKGSSAMPHKRNPIICERIAGMARILRGNSLASMENITLWHERDISHSSVERVIVPDSTIILNYMLFIATRLIDQLIIYPENMEKNLFLTRGLIFSQRVLLKLTEKGLSREASYAAVQEPAMKVWRDSKKNLKSELQKSDIIKKHISPKEMDALFDKKASLKHIDEIFARTVLKP
jgi:adenylosuccinate lyase